MSLLRLIQIQIIVHISIRVARSSNKNSKKTGKSKICVFLTTFLHLICICRKTDNTEVGQVATLGSGIASFTLYVDGYPVSVNTKLTLQYTVS